MLMGVGGLITGIVLCFVMNTVAFMFFVFPAALGFAGGALVLWGARRSRLQIDASGFTWAGFFGTERSVRWDQLQQIVPPTPGYPRLIAFALLRDGSWVPVEALWEPPTLPSVMGGGPDHADVHDALVAAHRTWLAGYR